MGDGHSWPLQLFVELTSSLVQENSLEESLNLVTDAALELLKPADHSSVRVVDDTKTKLLCGARSGKGARTMPMALMVGEGVLGWVVENARPALVVDALDDDRFKRGDGGQGFQIRSIVAIPLISSGKVLGVLGATSPLPSAFSEEQRDMAVLLANCAAPIIEKARLERLAVTDHHTMAYNQRYLLPRLREELERAQRYGEPLSLLLMDLDRFKLVNDNHGHAVGDLVLESFAECVRATVRLVDIFIRRGGDEFLLIAPSTTLEDATSVAERINACVGDKPMMSSLGVPITQTVSIGVTQWDGAESAEQLEQRADAVMYEAKEKGRNRVVAG